MTMAISRSIALFTVAGIAMTLRAQAEDAPDAATKVVDGVDITKWVCKFCTFEEGFSFDPELGVGYVSDDSAKFGEYTGLDQQGTYLVANGDARYRHTDGVWLDLSAVDLGLDSRYFGVEGGKQGQYELHFNYKELPHFISDTARTPFLGAGSQLLTLPAGWIPGATTDTMNALDASLRDVNFETKRKLLDLGGTLESVQHWAFAINVRHEDKSGMRGTGGSFVFNDARLPMPVDYTTDQFDASAAYTAARFQARIAYYGSIFKNDDHALVWSNPYIPLGLGGTQGQLGLAPDSQFHQLVISAGYRASDMMQLTAQLAAGRMTQDDSFLSYTINPALATQPLPRNSLDGLVDTLSWNFKLNATPADKVRLNLTASYDDRNNHTPQSVYDWVTTDSGLAAPRTNLPYSFNHGLLSADVSWAFDPMLHLYGGCSLDEIRRDLQEVGRTQEGSCWGKGVLDLRGNADVSLRYTHAERTVSDYLPNPDGTPPQNALMRLYNMADRDRDELLLRIDVMKFAKFTFGFDGDVTWDKYYNTAIGLLDGRSWSAAADCAWTLSEKFSANCYFSHGQIVSSQANAEMLAPSPLWFGDSTDTTDSAGAGLKYTAGEKFDFGVDYTYSRSKGEILMQGATAGFPDLKSELNSAKLYVNFTPKKKLSLRLTYWYESYRSNDWALDNVAPNTISNVLAFGEQSPNYDINVISLAARYQF